MSDWTPTTEQVREDFATRMAPHLDESRREMFDRWLERVKAEVWDECCYETMGQGTAQIPDNPYRKERKNEYD